MPEVSKNMILNQYEPSDIKKFVAMYTKAYRAMHTLYKGISRDIPGYLPSKRYEDNGSLKI